MILRSLKRRRKLLLKRVNLNLNPLSPRTLIQVVKRVAVKAIADLKTVVIAAAEAAVKVIQTLKVKRKRRQKKFWLNLLKAV